MGIVFTLRVGFVSRKQVRKFVIMANLVVRHGCEIRRILNCVKELCEP
jgi:hypothetical protein